MRKTAAAIVFVAGLVIGVVSVPVVAPRSNGSVGLPISVCGAIWIGFSMLSYAISKPPGDPQGQNPSAPERPEAERPWLGLRTRDIPRPVARERNIPRYGVLVTSVISNEAKASGIEVGDVIVSVNGTAIDDSEDFSVRVRSDVKPGDVVLLSLLRNTGAFDEVSLKATVNTRNLDLLKVDGRDTWGTSS